MSEEKDDYCIVATNRADNIRRDITGRLPKSAAEHRIKNMSAWDKKYWKFFKIARHPFKPSIGGTGGTKVK